MLLLKKKKEKKGMRALKAENDEGFHVSMHLCMWSEK